MSKPWEVDDHGEIEARIAAARQMRRDELGPWFAEAWRGLVDALASLGPAGGRGTQQHHQRPSA